MAAPIVQIEGLSKQFNRHKALDRVSLSVSPGEIVGLLGPNGAGKTTLSHILLGLLLPGEGEVRLFGLRMPEHRQEILRRANFSSAYVQMPLSLTPRQNLEVFAGLYGVESAGRKIEKLLKRFEIHEMADRPTRAMSSGQVSRLNLAKALLNDPELLLLDEPTSSMDPDIADKTRVILREIQKERNMAVLYTSHNMREIEEMAGRVYFLHKGKVVAAGTPKELLSNYQEQDLEKLFLRLARQ